MPAFRRLLLSVAVLLAAFGVCHGHNITKILEHHPEFSTFNHYLTLTHLAPEINRRLTITVLALDNSAMSSLLSKHLSISTIKNILSLHILADYFGSKKLHQITHRSALVASLFQATGAAPGTTGFVNVTNFKGGKVSFGAEDNNGILDANFVKSIKEIPYNISIVQISSLLASPEASAPTPPPSSYDLALLMSKKGCKVFAALLTANSDVKKMFESSVDNGLTIFCPIDAAMNKFMPKYTKLTPDEQSALLLYHGVPLYNSMQDLKTSSGKVDTLATEGESKNYNFTVAGAGEVASIKTRVNSASVTGTVIDDQPLAIYTLDKVLQPGELFKVPETLALSPKGDDSSSSDDGSTADQTAANKNAGGRVVAGGRWVVAAATVASLVVGTVGF